MTQSNEQTANQHALQMACEVLFAQQFPVPVINNDGEMLALGKGYRFFIVRDTKRPGHFEVGVPTPKARYVGILYSTSPENRDASNQVPDEVVQAIKTAEAFPVHHTAWIMQKSGQVTEIILTFIAENEVPAAVLAAPKGHKPALQSKLYGKDNHIKLDLFWQLARKGRLTPVADSESFEILRAPNGITAVRYRQQLFAKPAEWPKLERYAESDFTVIDS